MCMAQCLFGLSLVLAPPVRAEPAAAALTVKIGEITFDPIGPGKNRVNFSIQNTGDAEQRIGVKVIARSADGRNTWKGWTEYGTGAASYDSEKWTRPKAALDANEMRSGHYLFQIPEPFGDRAGITVEFYNLLDPKQKALAARKPGRCGRI